MRTSAHGRGTAGTVDVPPALSYSARRAPTGDDVTTRQWVGVQRAKKHSLEVEYRIKHLLAIDHENFNTTPAAWVGGR